MLEHTTCSDLKHSKNQTRLRNVCGLSATRHFGRQHSAVLIEGRNVPKHCPNVGTKKPVDGVEICYFRRIYRPLAMLASMDRQGSMRLEVS